MHLEEQPLRKPRRKHPGLWHIARLLLILIHVEDRCNRGDPIRHRHRPGLMVVLFAAQVEVPVQQNLLLHPQDSHVSWKCRHCQTHQDPCDDYAVLGRKEKHDFVGMRPVIERVCDEDDNSQVGHHGQDTEDVEGRVPRFVVRRLHREGPTVDQDELLLIQETFEEASNEGKQRHPRARHHEECSVAVQNEDLVHILVQIMRLLLALLLWTRNVLHHRMGALERVPGAEGVLLRVGPVGHFDVRPAQFNEVLQGDTRHHEDGQLGAQVHEAVPVHALHRHAEEMAMRLKEGDVVKRDVGVDKLEDDGLRKEMVGVL
mmetsp:Transcript_9686/g.21643  ORF Transcript_9686/g.21643 Transcript_9686/m.21643 type:complete len:316 (-) Transcript_9686:1400-2347(-)